jgi:hypothetical protein
MTWQEIALEYHKEILQLHREIDAALVEFEKRIPRSFEKGIGILDKAMDDSGENLRLIRTMESHVKHPIVSKKHKDGDDDLKKCFGEIL